MSATSIEFLRRLQTNSHSGMESPSGPWNRFYDVYGPFISNWLVQQGVRRADAEDIQQEVVCILLRELPHFCHNGSVGAFRCWLRRITQNQLRRHRRTHGRERDAAADLVWLAKAMADANDACRRHWDREHDRFVIEQLLFRIRGDFHQSTLAAFERTALEGHSPHDVAQDLNLTAAAVIAGKSRVLCRLREEAASVYR